MVDRRIKVLCVDDSAELTSAWTRFFALQGDIETVGVLDRADDLPAIAETKSPDVVLLDLTMDGRDPLDVVAELSQTHPDVRVLICSGRSDGDLIARAMDAGAWGFVDKAEEPQQVLDAIRRASRGETPLPRR
jgi:two-component system, NarL family, response regulator DesR